MYQFSAMGAYRYAQIDEGPCAYKRLAVVWIKIFLAYQAHSRVDKKGLGEREGCQTESWNNRGQE